MNIYNNINPTVHFDEIKQGEVFVLQGEICMRTETLDDGMHVINAVELSEGLLFHVDDFAVVMKCGADLNVS